MEENKKSIQDKLTTIKYECCDRSHLILDLEKCVLCKDKPCTFICPAGVYEKNESDDEIVVQFENCLECGACKVVCPKNAINWNYPNAGRGVVFKNS